MSDMSQSPKEASRDWAIEAKLFSLASTVVWMHTGPCPAPSLLVWCSCLSHDFVQQHRPRSWLWPPQPCSNCHPPVPGPGLMSSSGAVGLRWEEGSWASPGAAWPVLLQGVDPGRHVPQSRLFREVSTHCGRVRGVCFCRRAQKPSVTHLGGSERPGHSGGVGQGYPECRPSPGADPRLPVLCSLLRGWNHVSEQPLPRAQ